jgi:alanine dehydrogenase
VTNIPGQFPRTASRALSAAIPRKVLLLAEDPGHPGLEGACNVSGGRVVHDAVATALNGGST